VLAAEFALTNATKEEVSAKIEQFSSRRKATQPPGASMGSMFKNPEGDYAGRLIEAAGLKGTASAMLRSERTATSSTMARHGHIRALIDLVRKTVKEKFGIKLNWKSTHW
jgi:UDP-N-acetylmuramate dehydrogenase